MQREKSINSFKFIHHAGGAAVHGIHHGHDVPKRAGGCVAPVAEED